MNPLRPILILLAAFLAVFAQAAFHGLHHLLGVQINFLPALVVCASLRTGLTTMIATAAFGGLCFDSLSENPLGISVLPLFIAGFIVCWKSDLILRDQFYAQFVIGLIASALVPVMTLLLLMTSGRTPLLGLGTFWQWLVLTLAGGAATPVLFKILDWLEAGLSYKRAAETTFRQDREIRRGRT